MPFVQSQGAEIYWKVEGADDAPPLVLLNSIGTDMDLWDAALPMLRARFKLIRIDTRGHGASSAPEGDYDLLTLAGDVLAVLDAATVTKAAVAGVSLGGMIAMQLALDMPDRLSALALICTSATMDSASWTARIDKVRSEGMASIADLAMGRFLSPEFVAQHPEVAATLRRGLIGMSAKGYAGCGAAIRDMHIAERLDQIAVPAMVVTGSLDSSTPYEGHGEHLIRAIKEAQHMTLNAAHLAPIEASEELATAIEKFILS